MAHFHILFTLIPLQSRTLSTPQNHASTHLIVFSNQCMNHMNKTCQQFLVQLPNKLNLPQAIEAALVVCLLRIIENIFSGNSQIIELQTPALDCIFRFHLHISASYSADLRNANFLLMLLALHWICTSVYTSTW